LYFPFNAAGGILGGVDFELSDFTPKSE